MDLKPPMPMNLHGNVLDEWTRFKQKFMLYLEATEKSKKSGKTKTALLLCLLGDGCLEIFNTFKLDDKDDFDKVVELFDDYFKPRANTVIDRFRFFNLRQNTDESVDSFVTVLKTQASKCQFGDQEEDLVRDLLIIGAADKTSKEMLLMKGDLKLDSAIQLCKAKEVSQKQVKLLTDVTVVNARSNDSDTNSDIHNIRKNRVKNDSDAVKIVCSKCLRAHAYRSCPAWGKKCLNCKKFNHFAKACNVSQLNDVKTYEHNDNNNITNQEELVNIQSVLSVDSVYIWSQNIIVNGVDIKSK